VQFGTDELQRSRPSFRYGPRSPTSYEAHHVPQVPLHKGAHHHHVLRWGPRLLLS
jgi:hypothetical protein